MGKDRSFGVYRQQPSCRSHSLRCMGILPNAGQWGSAHPILFSACKEPHSFLDRPSGIVPGYAVYEFPELKSDGGQEQQSSYYGYCHLSLTPMIMKSSVLGKWFSAYPSELYGIDAMNSDKKKDAVLDPLKKHMSSIFTSVGHPRQDPLHAESLPIRESFVPNSFDIANWLESDENHAIGFPCGNMSEMHEDTEELDALLCSDDEDDEEISTGHSPSKIAGCSSREEYADNTEVVSSAAPTKRKRIDEEKDPLLMDTATSGKARGQGDDAELSCLKGTAPSSISKRLKAKRIRDTVGLLRSIIPGGKGKDAATILDEAIQYLKSLRMKAKTVGVGTV